MPRGEERPTRVNSQQTAFSLLREQRKKRRGRVSKNSSKMELQTGRHKRRRKIFVTKDFKKRRYWNTFAAHFRTGSYGRKG